MAGNWISQHSKIISVAREKILVLVECNGLF